MHRTLGWWPWRDFAFPSNVAWLMLAWQHTYHPLSTSGREVLDPSCSLLVSEVIFFYLGMGGKVSVRNIFLTRLLHRTEHKSSSLLMMVFCAEQGWGTYGPPAVVELQLPSAQPAGSVVRDGGYCSPITCGVHRFLIPDAEDRMVIWGLSTMPICPFGGQGKQVEATIVFLCCGLGSSSVLH